MTNEEREKQIVIANVLIGAIKDLNTPMLMCQIEKDVTKEALESYIKILEQQLSEKCEQPDGNDELLTPEERADILNAINDMLEEKGFDLEVGGYEDNDGVFFDVMLIKR